MKKIIFDNVLNLSSEVSLESYTRVPREMYTIVPRTSYRNI